MNNDFLVLQYTESIGAGKSVPVRLLKFFALVTGLGLQMRLPGRSGLVDLPINFVFGSDDGQDLGSADVVNPTGAAITFKVLTSSQRFVASANAANVAITGISTTIPVNGTDIVGIAPTVPPVLTAGIDGGGLVRTLKTDTTGRVEAVGPIAHGAAVSALAPVIAAAEARTTERTAVADAQAARLVCDSIGRLVTSPLAPPSLRLSAFVTIAAIGVVDLIAAQAAGVRAYLASLTIGNDGVGDNVAIILDGAAELLRVPVKAGATVQLLFPIPERTTAATALRVNITAATSMRIHAMGYKGV